MRTDFWFILVLPGSPEGHLYTTPKNSKQLCVTKENGFDLPVCAMGRKLVYTLHISWYAVII